MAKYFPRGKFVWAALTLSLGWLFMFSVFTLSQPVVLVLKSGSINDSFGLAGNRLSTATSFFNKGLSSDSTKVDFSALAPDIQAVISSRPLNLPSRVSVGRVVTLTFVGDIMLDRGVAASVRNNFNGNYEDLFTELGFLRDRDIVFGNLEGPLSDQGQDIHNLYSFRMKPPALPALVKAGFNVLSLANNHAGDWGREALIDTVDRLAGAGILTPGAGKRRAEAVNPQIKKVGDIKIGFLAFSDVGPVNLAVGDDQAGILLATDSNFTGIIRQATEAVDVLVVSFHFGEEYQTSPSPRQIALAEQAIDLGAKIIVGHHPHVIQPVVEYGGGLIAYSLGNFIFDQNFSAETMEGLVLEVELLNNDIADWRTRLIVLDNYFRPAEANNDR
ncbi:MAG: CapA family protein [Candidatus Paceibacterota bacterium]